MMHNQICTTCKKEFTLSEQDISFLSGFGVPTPTECHLCMWKHMLSFWVFGHFRKTTSALSGKSIITTFSDKVPFPLYSRDEWVSDAWDAIDYGRDYDFSRSFFGQFTDLWNVVPRPHQSGTKNIDCQWSDDVWNCKNCYLSRSMVECEDSFYLYRVFTCKDSIDATFCFDSEFIYDCLYCFKSSRIQYCIDTKDSIDSAFLFDCRNCQDCFMSWNLRNKQYCIENVQYTREEYKAKLAEFDTKSIDGVAKLKEVFWNHIRNDAIHRSTHNFKTENSTGNFLEECKNSKECYFLSHCENTSYVFRGGYMKDVMYSIGTITEKAYMSAIDGYTYDVVVSLQSGNCRYCAYINYCEECEYCFGCIGLRKKKYCILNKQYTKEEYEDLVPKIKEDMKRRGEYGLFFPKNLAYVGYNLSIGREYFPMNKEQALAWGGKWEDDEVVIQEGIRGNELPQTVDLVADDFSKQAIICPETNRRFNIAPGELQFYRRFGIPLPKHHPDYRTLNRLRPLTVITPYSYVCVYCSKDIVGYFPPEWNYKHVACDECYKQNIN